MSGCRLLGDPSGIEARAGFFFSLSSHLQSSKGPTTRQHGRLHENRMQTKAIANGAGESWEGRRSERRNRNRNRNRNRGGDELLSPKSVELRYQKSIIGLKMRKE